MKKLLQTTLLALLLSLLLPTLAGATEGETAYYLWQRDGTVYYTEVTASAPDPTTATGTELAGSGNVYSLSSDTGASYTLLNDISIGQTIQVTGTVTLDLNDHVLTMTGDSSVLQVGTSGVSGSLTLKDGSDSGTTRHFQKKQRDQSLGGGGFLYRGKL